MTKYSIVGLLVLFSLLSENKISAQVTEYELDSVQITAQRLLPVSYSFIPVDIQTSGVYNESLPVDMRLESLNGVSVNRRGTGDIQSDVYIRGGYFEQAGVMIDGVPFKDLQTGHHNMNLPMPLSAIESTEVIKGPASRLYGSNAMTGLLHFKTKDIPGHLLKAGIQTGAFQTFGGFVSAGRRIRNTGVFLASDFSHSAGYRYNSDYSISRNFIKFQYKKITLSGGYASRKFGANGFYASPDYKDQYEETQTGFGHISHEIKNSGFAWQNDLYWRYNRDDYVFLRQNPDYYHNIHHTHSTGFISKFQWKNSAGITGAGMHINAGMIRSNNLGNHEQYSAELFAEHLWEYKRFGLQPGFVWAYNQNSGFVFLPGINGFYRMANHHKLYVNTGFTSRQPGFTERYYSSPAEEGNPDLLPEKAFGTDVGFKGKYKRYSYQAGVFYRKTGNSIDWVKQEETDKWHAMNIAEIISKGFEFQLNKKINLSFGTAYIGTAYTFLDEQSQDTGFAYSRYRQTAYRHQFSFHARTQIRHFIPVLNFRYLVREQGDRIPVLDAGIHYQWQDWTISAGGRNLLNTSYTGALSVPMPGIHMMFELSYTPF